jgi:signal transduction histidine kinase
MHEFTPAAQPNSDKAKWNQDDLLAMVSHELRNPTWIILGWADVVVRRLVDVETMSRAIDHIKRSAQLQAQLINQLLDYSRINNSTLRLDTRRIEVASTLEAAVESMMPQAADKKIELHEDIDRSPASIVGDPIRLQQVFTNLLSNAIKFTPQGGRVDVFLERREAYAEITVSDTGRGITPEFLPHVFDRFCQETTDTSRYGGLGLGLAIARYLVEQHGGEIYADSHGKGKGATFTVRLPLEP